MNGFYINVALPGSYMDFANNESTPNGGTTAYTQYTEGKDIYAPSYFDDVEAVKNVFIPRHSICGVILGSYHEADAYVRDDTCPILTGTLHYTYANLDSSECVRLAVARQGEYANEYIMDYAYGYPAFAPDGYIRIVGTAPWTGEDVYGPYELPDDAVIVAAIRRELFDGPQSQHWNITCNRPLVEISDGSLSFLGYILSGDVNLRIEHRA